MSDEKSLISVIVPVYNVSKYLNKCVDSIINQTYRNIEVILIDDGSTDNCSDICDEYCKNDSRIKVIHKENGGLSSARNAGLEVFCGDYVVFVDSDDWLELDMIEKLYLLAKIRHADIAIVNYKRAENENVKVDRKTDAKFIEMSNIEALRNLYNTNVESQMVISCCKIYNKKLFEDVRFPEGRIHEDEFTTYKLLFKSDKVIYSDEKLYYYRVTPGSIMNSKFSIRRLDVLEAFKQRLEFAKKLEDKEFYIYTLRRYYLEGLVIYLKYKNCLKDKKDLTHNLVALDKDLGKKLLKTKSCTFYEGIKVRMFLFSSTLYYYFKNIL